MKGIYDSEPEVKVGISVDFTRVTRVTGINLNWCSISKLEFKL
jgi:hypothetical protein